MKFEGILAGILLMGLIWWVGCSGASAPSAPVVPPDPGIWEAAERVRLAWIAPTTNDDGSQLVSLAGYRVYQGLSSGVYNHFQIQRPTDPSLDVTLSPGLYFFCVTAFDDFGGESVCSNEIEVTVPIGE